MEKKEIYVVGYPKSGNTWMSRLLGDVLDSPVMSGGNKPALADEGFDRSGDYVIRQSHLLRKEKPNGAKAVFVLRDPRDVAVSVMFYWQRKSLMKVISGMAGIQSDIQSAPLHKSGGWINYVRRWLITEDSGLSDVVKYEDLSKDTYTTLGATLIWLSAKPVKSIAEAVERQSFASRKKSIHKDLPYGDTIQNRLMRKGVPGDWVNHFNRKQAKFFHEHFYDTMKVLEYENDPDWWKQCA
jgi:hypothetical protein